MRVWGTFSELLTIFLIPDHAAVAVSLLTV